MPDLPSGTVTFLFTDVEGSTRLLQELGDGYADVLAEHRRILREAFKRHGGVEVDTQGDAFFVAFAKATEALAAAAEAREALATGPIRVRMGLHTGEPVVTDEGYVGIDVHRAARIAAAGHGGQILVSNSTADLAQVGDLRDLGDHRLKDLTSPERIYQLGAGDFGPLKSLNQSNLPVASTAMIGREQEVSEVARLLQSARVVTVTGPGGTGKTRLALQVCAELVEEFVDGVWFVPLAPVNESQLVDATMVRTLGLRSLEELNERDALLLLDNFEHLLEAGDGLANLMSTAPRLKLLITSRIRLRIHGETQYLLEPLSELEAETLFVERARAVRRAFKPSDAVTEICTRLDRLPLALELAAARTTLLEPEALLERLDRSLGLLSFGARDAPSRQQTLSATIEWSYLLLDDAARRAFEALAVFPGSFSLEAAEFVVDEDLDTVAALVDASLLKKLPNGRLLMLETIREYALSRISGAAREGAEQRHLEYFGRLADFAAGPLRTAEGADFDTLELEHSNFVAAIAAALSKGDGAVSLVACVGLLWFVRGRLLDGSEWTEAALGADAARGPDRETAIKWAFWFALDRGDYVRTLELARERLELARELGDERRIAGALLNLGRALEVNGDLAGAVHVNEEALAIGRSLGLQAAVIGSLSQLAELRARLGDVADGLRLSEEVLELAYVDKDFYVLPTALRDQGWFLLRWGDPQEAVRFLAEAIELARPLDLREIVDSSLAGLAVVAGCVNEDREAARLLAAFDRCQRERAFVPETWISEVLDPLRERLCAELNLEEEALPLDDALDEALVYAARHLD